jgi:hypothetical protein
MIPSARRDVAVRKLDAPSLVRTIATATPAGRYTPPAAKAMQRALADGATRLLAEIAARV